MFMDIFEKRKSCPHSWLITGLVARVTRRVPLVHQELLTSPVHLSSPPVFSGVRLSRSLVFCVVFCRWLFVPLSCFPLIFSVLLVFSYSDCTFGIFKLFLYTIYHKIYKKSQKMYTITLNVYIWPHLNFIWYLQFTCLSKILMYL